jgi:hypothetical protein
LDVEPISDKNFFFLILRKKVEIKIHFGEKKPNLKFYLDSLKGLSSET